MRAWLTPFLRIVMKISDIVIETPEEKAQRKGVPLIPKRLPVKSMRSDSVVAICGECGLEITMSMGYCCSRSNCPTGLGSPYSLAAKTLPSPNQ